MHPIFSYKLRFSLGTLITELVSSVARTGMTITSSPGRVILIWTFRWSSLERWVSFWARRRNEWKKVLLLILWSCETESRVPRESISTSTSTIIVSKAGLNSNLLDWIYFSNWSLRSSVWKGLSGRSFLEGNSGKVSVLKSLFSWSCRCLNCL